MIRLIIKGTAEEARAALDKRGLLTVMAMDPRPAFGTVEANVHDSDEGMVQAWFLEQAHPPFPPGTLLLYTYEKNK